jgi:hypothetical protein
MEPETRKNIMLYILFLVIALIGIPYGRDILNDYAFIRVWEFSNLLILLVGVPFLAVQAKAGLPDFLTNTIPHKKRFLIPVMIGIIFGLLDVLVVKIMMHPEPYQELPPFLQPFPYSLFLYFSGAFEIEVFYRLIPLTLILLMGTWFKHGKYYTAFFWTGVILTALREPLEQLPAEGGLFISYSLLTGFMMNLLQAVWYKKAGFLAAITLRLGHYLIWHILLGLYVQFFELTR